MGGALPCAPTVWSPDVVRCTRRRPSLARKAAICSWLKTHTAYLTPVRRVFLGDEGVQRTAIAYCYMVAKIWTNIGITLRLKIQEPRPRPLPPLPLPPPLPLLLPPLNGFFSLPQSFSCSNPESLTSMKLVTP